MARLNKFFEYLEDLILSIIALMTIGAVGFELYDVFERGSIELADLLLMFIYAEVLGMVAIYFRSHVLPVIYPLFIGITALACLPFGYFFNCALAHFRFTFENVNSFG